MQRRAYLRHCEARFSLLFTQSSHKDTGSQLALPCHDNVGCSSFVRTVDVLQPNDNSRASMYLSDVPSDQIPGKYLHTNEGAHRARHDNMLRANSRSHIHAKLARLRLNRPNKRNSSMLAAESAIRNVIYDWADFLVIVCLATGHRSAGVSRAATRRIGIKIEPPAMQYTRYIASSALSHTPQKPV